MQKIAGEPYRPREWEPCRGREWLGWEDWGAKVS